MLTARDPVLDREEQAVGDAQLTPFVMQAALPDLLEFTGEFGAEINSFLPFIYWLHLAGAMRGRRIRTYGGMQPFYFFLEPTQILPKAEPRMYVHPQQRPAWLPTRDDHRSRRNAFEVFPDYRAQFGNRLFAADKPLLVVHNKFTREWDRPPVNFLSLELLSAIFGGLGDRFMIVYTRPGIKGGEAGFSADQQDSATLDDLALVRRHHGVLQFEDVVAAMARERSYNELKLMLFASSYFHITVQGGNAHLTSLFPGSLVAILHRFGQEILHAYRGGHFRYAANPRPDYLICRSEDEMRLALDVIAGSTLVGGRAMLPTAAAAAIGALSPAAQCGAGRMDPVAWR